MASLPADAGYTVRRLATTPIKGFALAHPGEVWLDHSGARGDRDLFLLDANDKLLSITRTGAFAGVAAEYGDGGETLTLRRGGSLLASAPLAPGPEIATDFFGLRTVPGRLCAGPWDEALSELAGAPVRVVRCEAPGAGSDVHPVTLLGSASVDELSRRLGEPVDARRFRMLIELHTEVPHEEDGWDGMRLEGDEVAIRVRGPVPRCAAVTRHPDRGDRDVPVVKAIKGYRGMGDTELGPGVCFGVYGSVLREGRLRVGERLLLGR